MPLDEDAVAAIYREHGPMLHRVALRASGSPARAEEIVQEVILRVWQRAPDVADLGAYLARAVRNLAVDQHRASARRPAEVAEAAGTGAAEQGGGGPAQVDQALDRLLVEEALTRLSPEHLAVVRALHYERLTVAEAAVRLGLPPGTVKSRAFYAVRHLREIFDEMGVTR